MKCSYCGSESHTVQNCPKTFIGIVNRARLYCTHCGSKSHNYTACPKAYGGKQDESNKNDYVLDK